MRPGTFIGDAFGGGSLVTFNGGVWYCTRAQAEAWCAENGARFVVVNQQQRTRNSEFRADRRDYL